MDVTRVDLWNCLQLPERNAFQAVLTWIDAAGFSCFPAIIVDASFDIGTAGGLKRRDAWITSVSIQPMLCPLTGEEPEPGYIVMAPGEWSEWLALWRDGELVPGASCSLPLFP